VGRRKFHRARCARANPFLFLQVLPQVRLVVLRQKRALARRALPSKLDVLRVECTKCDRKGRYSVAKLIAKHGRNGNMSTWPNVYRGACCRPA
jgi:hypothetical protein